MYTQYGSPPSTFSFDFAACSSTGNPIEVTYTTVTSGVYYVLVTSQDATTATVVLIGQQ